MLMDYEEAIAATAAACAADPVAASTREALVRIEYDANRKGWDQAPSVWRLNIVGADTIIYEQSQYSDLVLDMSEHHDVPQPRALAMLADVCEWATNPEMPAPSWADPKAVNTVTRATVALGMTGGSRGRRPIFGYGFMCEVWQVTAAKADVDDSAAMRKLLRERKLRTHPDRVEARSMMFCDQIGHMWTVARVRGGAAHVIRSSILDSHVVGTVGNALSRIVRATGADIPIVPTAEAGDSGFTLGERGYG